MASSKGFRTLLLVLRLALGGIFAFAAWVKLKDPISRALFAMDLDAYKIIPLRYVQTVALAVPIAELAFAALLIVSAIGVMIRPENRGLKLGLRLSSVLVCLSLAVFIGAMTWAKASGKNIDCGCFGPGEKISWKTMVRDGSMLAAAAFVTFTAFLPRRRSTQEKTA